MQYTEIADLVYRKEGLIGLIPEGRKATPLLPGILDKEEADCMITYAEDEGDRIELYHVIRVSGDRIDVTDCKCEKITVQPRSAGNMNSLETDKTIRRYAELYTLVRSKITESAVTDENRELIREFLEHFEALSGISVNYILEWFGEYTRLLSKV